MSNNQSEKHTKNKSEITKNTQEALKDLHQLFSKVGTSTITNVKDLFLWIYNSIVNFFTKCSMLVHFLVILVPISILFIFLIFYLHIKFYDGLFRYNYYKGVKDEFLDGYITEIDDMQSSLQILTIKENYLDFENVLFFEIYYNELINLGLLDEENYTFPGIAENSDNLYSFYQNGSENCDYFIPKEDAERYLDNRPDSLKELGKIYYYMLPIINYGFKFMGITINQTYLLAYEFNNNREIIGNELFFAFPKSNLSTKAHNFIVSHRYLNPLVVKKNYTSSALIDGAYYEENFFEKKDYEFRKNVEIKNNTSFSKISLSHFNYEFNGNITKSILSTLQLYTNHNGKNYIINIITNIQEKEIKNDAIEYSAFIYSPDLNMSDYEDEKYSDSATFLISSQNFIEYSLTTLDNKYFHYGLFDKNGHFYSNGVFFDSFNYDLLSDPLKYYSTVNGYNIDLKYLSSLYLYAKTYQNVNLTSSLQKEEDDLILNTFEDSTKIREICQNLNLKQYIEYIKSEEAILDCWESQNEFYYANNEQEKTFNIYSLPYCTCIPLYCLDNYQSLKENKYEFSDNNFVSKINLPNKCQNKFRYYSNENMDYSISNFVFKLFNSNSRNPENKYLRFENNVLTQLPGYYLFTVSEINSNDTYIFYLFYDSNTKLKLIVIILIFLVVIFSLSIVIIYEHLKKITSIINEFKEMYEKYIYNSTDTDLITSSIHDKNSKKNKNNESHKEKKFFEKNNDNNENTSYMHNNNSNSLLNELYNNENSLIEELFLIFCKYYRITRYQLEKYYSRQQHESKYQLKMKMMMEKNELFKLLCMFCIYAPCFRLNLSLEYNTYKYSKLIKKFDKNILQISNVDKEQIKLTRNILYELISTENIPDYGLIMNLNFKYISNINFETKKNSIQNAVFKNIYNNMKNENNIHDDMDKNEEKQNVKLVLKNKNEFIDLFKNNFESDDYLNLKKLESSFNFFLINSYYKYLKQISEENKDINNKTK